MDDPEEEGGGGIPAWVMTFADLMSLLMCFFVLLLSFAEMDAMRFKQIAGEMAKAFGVQRDVAAADIPMGTSPIFDKFSPGVPTPTPIDSVRQQTSQDAPRLRTFSSDAKVEAQVQQTAERQMQKSTEQIREVLQRELSQGLVQLDQDRKRIIIRIEEKGSFPSGSSELSPLFVDLLGRIGQTLSQLPGELTVEGHTDDIPISTARFRSNWDLSAARASSVANALLDSRVVEPTRLRVQGFADTRPRNDNSTAANRALNRRVEIIADLSEPLEAFEAKARELLEQGMDDMIPYMGWQQSP